jgi:hypothetical protein
VDCFGHSYEKAAIVRWLSSNNKSPLTGKEMTDQTLRVNHSLKQFIDATIKKPAKKKMKKKMKAMR